MLTCITFNIRKNKVSHLAKYQDIKTNTITLDKRPSLCANTVLVIFSKSVEIESNLFIKCNLTSSQKPLLLSANPSYLKLYPGATLFSGSLLSSLRKV